MSPSLRRFLVVLLMLALPWQGVAAAGMQLCGAMHGAGSAYAVEGHPAHGDAAVADASATPVDRASHCHATGEGAAVDAGDSSDTDAAPGSCSACAVCCLTAATAAGALDIGHPRLAGVHAGAVISPQTGRPPERLERPPRVA